MAKSPQQPCFFSWKARHVGFRLKWLSNGQKENSKISSICFLVRGTHMSMLLEAERKTKDEMDAIRRQLIQQGLTPQQAHDQAWEMVREKYILLPAEND